MSAANPRRAGSLLCDYPYLYTAVRLRKPYILHVLTQVYVHVSSRCLPKAGELLCSSLPQKSQQNTALLTGPGASVETSQS